MCSSRVAAANAVHDPLKSACDAAAQRKIPAIEYALAGGLMG